MSIKKRHKSKWTRISDEEFTNMIYQKKYRLDLPDDGEKLIETEEELVNYLRMFYE
jgi:hypothetical protein